MTKIGCYLENCKYNKGQECNKKNIIIRKDNSCAYYIINDDWKSKIRRED